MPTGITSHTQSLYEVLQGTAPTQAAGPMGSQTNPWTRPGGAAGQWFQGSRPGQFGHPTMQQLPGNINEIRGQMNKYQGYPTGYPWSEEQNKFKSTWEGVFEPMDFNMGPRMASAPLGEGAGPSAPIGGWAPAMAEGTPMWEEPNA